MKGKQEEFDALGFLELLGDSLRERLRYFDAGTGVMSARIHIRDGEPWAVSVQFDNADKRAA